MTPDERDALLIENSTRLNDLHRALLGNGQPGRIKEIEERVDSLEDSRTRAKGWIAGASAVATMAWAALEYLFHRRS